MTDSPADTEEEERDGLAVATRVVLLGIYLCQLVVVVDFVTHGEVGDRLRRWWRQRVRGPLDRKEELRRAEAWVVWEAMQVLQEGAA